MSRLFSLMVLLAVVAPLAGCLPDEAETLGEAPADETGSAAHPYTLTVGQSRTGSVGAGGSTYYKFTTSGDAEPHLIGLYGAGTDVGYGLYDDSGFSNLIDGCNDFSISPSEECISQLLSGSRTYFVRVVNFDPALATYEIGVDSPGFYDGLEDGTYSDVWTAPLSADYTNWFVDTGNGTGGSSFSLRLLGGNSTHLTGFDTTLDTPEMPETIGYNVASASTSTAAGYFIAEDTSGNFMTVIRLGASGQIVVQDSGTTGLNAGAYTANQWHRIELRNIDWSAKRFDIWVDGSQVQTNFPFFDSPTSNIATIYLYNFSPGSDALWDEISFF